MAEPSTPDRLAQAARPSVAPSRSLGSPVHPSSSRVGWNERRKLAKLARAAYAQGDMAAFLATFDSGLPPDDIQILDDPYSPHRVGIKLALRRPLDRAIADRRVPWALELWKRGFLCESGAHPLFEAALSDQTPMAKAFLMADPPQLLARAGFLDGASGAPVSLQADALWVATRHGATETAKFLLAEVASLVGGPEDAEARESLGAAHDAAVFAAQQGGFAATEIRKAFDRCVEALNSMSPGSAARAAPANDPSLADPSSPADPSLLDPSSPEFAQAVLTQLANLRKEADAHRSQILAQAERLMAHGRALEAQSKEIARLRLAASEPEPRQAGAPGRSSP